MIIRKIGHKHFDAMVPFWASIPPEKMTPAMRESIDWYEAKALVDRVQAFIKLTDGSYLVGNPEAPTPYTGTATLDTIHMVMQYAGNWVDITDHAGGSSITNSATRQRIRCASDHIGEVSAVLATEIGDTNRLQLRTIPETNRLEALYQPTATSPKIIFKERTL